MEKNNLTKMALERAIRRMSYDYERKEEQLKERHSFLLQREANMEKYKLNQTIEYQPQSKEQEAKAEAEKHVHKMKRLDFSDTVQQQAELREGGKIMVLETFEPRDFQSNISQFSILKTLFINASVS